MKDDNAPTAPRPDAAAGAGLPAFEPPVQDALRALLRPLARLAVAHGLPYARLEELLKGALVEAAREAHPGVAPERSVSRISTTLGLNRREVTRLTRAAQAAPAPLRPAPATELFTRWRTDPALRGSDGQPLALPRLGAAPSFEALAQSLTQDVHPRSLLDELCRLGLARLDEAADRVELLDPTFVPRGDRARMLGFLADNVGDHAAAAVDNVLGDGRRHFEQAVFADELSSEAMPPLREAVAAYWQQLMKGIVPQLETLIAADRAAGRPQDRRVRIGLYTYEDRMVGAATPADSPSPLAAAASPRRRPRRG